MDLLICCTLFPVINAFLEETGMTLGTGNASLPLKEAPVPTLFSQGWFCTVWGLLWEALPSVSVFLVGVLSISRLILLLKPTRKLNLYVMSGVMVAYICATAAAKMTLFLTSDDMKYWPVTRYCFLVSHDDGNFTQHEIITLTVMITQLALPILPVTVSFVLSIVVLCRSKHGSSKTSKMKHRAACTVVIVTLVYIVFNIPVVVNYCFYLSKLFGTQEAGGEHDHVIFDDIYSSKFSFYYSWPLMYIVSVSINSAVNPLIYYFRMKKFSDAIRSSFMNLTRKSRTWVISSAIVTPKVTRV